MTLAVEGEQETGGQACAVYKWPVCSRPCKAQRRPGPGRDLGLRVRNQGLVALIPHYGTPKACQQGQDPRGSLFMSNALGCAAQVGKV